MNNSGSRAKCNARKKARGAGTWTWRIYLGIWTDRAATLLDKKTGFASAKQALDAADAVLWDGNRGLMASLPKGDWSWGVDVLPYGTVVGSWENLNAPTASAHVTVLAFQEPLVGIDEWQRARARIAELNSSAFDLSEAVRIWGDEKRADQMPVWQWPETAACLARILKVAVLDRPPPPHDSIWWKMEQATMDLYKKAEVAARDLHDLHYAPRPGTRS